MLWYVTIHPLRLESVYEGISILTQITFKSASELLNHSNEFHGKLDINLICGIRRLALRDMFNEMPKVLYFLWIYGMCHPTILPHYQLPLFWWIILEQRVGYIHNMYRNPESVKLELNSSDNILSWHPWGKLEESLCATQSNL